jgi:DnaK suppressor protein
MKTLSDTHLHTLNSVLLARQDELLSRLRAQQDLVMADMVAAAPEVEDRKDQASEEMFLQLQDQASTRDRFELLQVRNALARLATAEFGICLDCGRPIGLERLLAIPSASRCLSCEGIRETEAARP